MSYEFVTKPICMSSKKNFLKIFFRCFSFTCLFTALPPSWCGLSGMPSHGSGESQMHGLSVVLHREAHSSLLCTE